MAQQQPGKLGTRAQVNSSWLYRIFSFAFALLFAGTLVIALLGNSSIYYYNLQWTWLLLCVAVGCLFFWLVYQLMTLLPTLEGAIEATIVAMLFVVFITVQIYAGWMLRVYPGNAWDFGVVYSYAEQYVLNGIKPDDYFLYFPNNTGLYVFWCGFMSVFKQMGMRDFTIAAFGLNILSINVAILLLYLCARRLFGMQRALLALLAAFVTLPFILYIPIYYTDTLTLVFPIGGVYLWLKARGDWRENSFGKALRGFCLLSLLLGLGALLKVTVLIVWIAITLDLLILLGGKGRVRMLLAGLGILALVYAGGTWLLRQSALLPAYDYSKGFPFTHWIMMGLGGDGGYSDADYQYVLNGAADKVGRGALITAEIENRLSSMGFLGVLEHLVNKLRFTFGDGSYTAIAKLDRGAVAPGSLHEFFVPTGRYVGISLYAGFAVQAAMLVGMVVASIKAVLRKNDCLSFVRVAVFGLVLFLLLWETRARYLVNFLPLMILCAVEAFPTTGRGPVKAGETAAKGKASAPKASGGKGKKKTAGPAGAKKAPEPAPLPEPQADGQAPEAPEAEASLFGEAVEETQVLEIIPEDVLLGEIEDSAPVAVNDLAAGEAVEVLLQDEPQADEAEEAVANAPDAGEDLFGLFGEEDELVSPSEDTQELFPAIEAEERVGDETVVFTIEADSGDRKQEAEDGPELFDVPTGDPFFEIARTTTWNLEELQDRLDGEDTD